MNNSRHNNEHVKGQWAMLTKSIAAFALLLVPAGCQTDTERRYDVTKTLTERIRQDADSAIVFVAPHAKTLGAVKCQYVVNVYYRSSNNSNLHESIQGVAWTYGNGDIGDGWVCFLRDGADILHLQPHDKDSIRVAVFDSVYGLRKKD